MTLSDRLSTELIGGGEAVKFVSVKRTEGFNAAVAMVAANIPAATANIEADLKGLLLPLYAESELAPYDFTDPLHMIMTKHNRMVNQMAAAIEHYCKTE